MDIGRPATNRVSSQAEPPSPPDLLSTQSPVSEHAIENAAEHAIGGAAEHAIEGAAPKTTNPLPQEELTPPQESAPVAREHALVAAAPRGGMPAALTEPPSLLALWWKLLRPGRLWLSLWSIILGAAIAWFGSSGSSGGVFHPIRLVVFALAVLAIHAGANLLNEYYDVQRGADVEAAPGTSGVLQKGLLSEEMVQRAGLVSLAAGALVLLIVVLVAHAWSALILGAAAVLLAYLYSATPYALGYWWLGEVVIGFVMGPAIVISSVQIQGAQVGSLAITFSLALGAFAAAVTLAKNLRDMELDRAANKRTLATLLGPQMGRTLYLALVLLPYLFVVVVAFPHGRPHGVLLVLLTAAELVVVMSGILRAEAPAATNVVAAQTMRLHWRFSLCLLVGYLLSIAVVALTGFLGI